jgi:hypothetical protein
MKFFRLFLAAAGATVLLGTLVSTASAGRLSISNQNIRSTWSTVTFSGGFGSPRCHLTLEGSLHARTMIKSLGTLMGYITSAIVSACQNGSATILRETLPWHVRYSGFEPALPNIEDLIVHVIGAAWRVRETFGLTCLTTTTATEPGVGTFRREAGGALTETEISGETECGGGVRGILESVQGTVSLLGTPSTRITVTLI